MYINVLKKFKLIKKIKFIIIVWTYDYILQPYILTKNCPALYSAVSPEEPNKYNLVVEAIDITSELVDIVPGVCIDAKIIVWLPTESPDAKILVL